eukprot:9476-Heterococcus_DN1.PRE.3
MSLWCLAFELHGFTSTETSCYCVSTGKCSTAVRCVDSRVAAAAAAQVAVAIKCSAVHALEHPAEQLLELVTLARLGISLSGRHMQQHTHKTENTKASAISHFVIAQTSRKQLITCVDCFIIVRAAAIYSKNGMSNGHMLCALVTSSPLSPLMML